MHCRTFRLLPPALLLALITLPLQAGCALDKAGLGPLRDTGTPPEDDGGTRDGGTSDGGTVDGGASDGGASDGGPVDGGGVDGGPVDGGCATAAEVCDPAMSALIGCAGGVPTSTTCPMGCLAGNDYCNDCAPNTGTCPGNVATNCDSAGRETTMDCGADSCVSDGVTATCMSVGCGAAGDTRCSGTVLLTCDGSGGEAMTTCPLGCLAAGGAHCGALVPTNVGTAIAMDAGSGSVTVGGGETWVFLTDDGRIILEGGGDIRPAGTGPHAGSGIYFETLTQGGGAPDLGVWVMDALDLPAGARISFTGDNAAALLVTGDATLSGTVDARSWSIDGGPFRRPAGGSFGGAASSDGTGSGAGSGGVASSGDSGGGGGGFGSGGGRGGRSGGSGPAGGGMYGNTQLAPLLGGSGGGGGSCAPSGEARGGYGGGAIQISVGGTLTISGIVDASGSAGRAANAATATRSCGGGGGGSGGGVLLEAATVSITGVIGAPGSGGGGGDQSSGGTAGSSGRRWAPPGDLLGDGGAGGGGDGGDGGDGSSQGGGDGQAGEDVGNGGGGGGGAGRVRVNSYMMSFDPSGGTYTPDFTTLATEGGVTVQ